MRAPKTDKVLVTCHKDLWHEATVKSLLSVQFTAEYQEEGKVKRVFHMYNNRNITWREPEEGKQMGAAKQASLKTTAKIGKLKVTKNNLKTAVKKSKDKVAVKGLDMDRVIVNNPAKVARSKENAERHTELDGMTVREALATLRVEAKDIRYDLDKEFMLYK
tara:strand:+ start:987 stop:1472 length:486 start_codon:yes stop_codon:yes gene_type:complete